MEAAVQTFRSEAQLILRAAAEASAAAFLMRASPGAEGQAALQTLMEAALTQALRKLCVLVQLLFQEKKKSASLTAVPRAAAAARRRRSQTNPAAVPVAPAVVSQSPVSVSVLNPAQRPITGPVYIIGHLPQPIAGQSIVQIRPNTEECQVIQFGPMTDKDDGDEAPFQPMTDKKGQDAVTSLPAARELRQTELIQGIKPEKTQTVPDAEQQRELERRRRRELYKLKRFFCDQCHKGFHQKHQLHKHLSSHSKPFTCPHCPQGFYTEAPLLRHLQHHQLRALQSQDPQHLLPCQHCDKKFSQLSGLRAHMASHRLQGELKCAQCEREFSSPAALRAHAATHLQTRPFTCDVCGRGFTRTREDNLLSRIGARKPPGAKSRHLKPSCLSTEEVSAGPPDGAHRGAAVPLSDLWEALLHLCQPAGAPALPLGRAPTPVPAVPQGLQDQDGPVPAPRGPL